MSGSADVRVMDAPAHIVIAPTSGTPTRGLIFQPGARVDPRAYVPMLSEVSRQGVLVFIVKQPFGIGFLATTAPHAFIDRHPEVTSWTIAGHSLGGVVAAGFAHDHPGVVRGLVLWASYPVDSLAERTDLAVASVSGTRDGFTTPADIEASRPLLPGDTAYTAVEGAVHSYFGDYGEQPGDGTPTVSRAEAQRQIVAATVALGRTRSERSEVPGERATSRARASRGTGRGPRRPRRSCRPGGSPRRRRPAGPSGRRR